MPTYLSPNKVPSCLCRSRRQKDACPYGHPDECHYSLSCTEAACGYIRDLEYTPDEFDSVTEASKKLIESLSSSACPDCGGNGLVYHELHREVFFQKVPLHYAQVCRCVISKVTSAKTRRTAVNVKQVEQAGQSKQSGSFTGELDLHGMRVEEALAKVDRLLSSAQDHHRETVVIIHGKGRGILRDEVKFHLRMHPLVRDFSPDGEDAVVHVTLRMTC